MCNSNELHDAEIDSARVIVGEDITKNSEGILQYFDGLFYSIESLPFFSIHC